MSDAPDKDRVVNVTPDTPVDDLSRDEAARLVQASLRPSRFLIAIQREDGEHEIRNYGVDFPSTVPIVTSHDAELQSIIGDNCRELLPDGGVICVPPPEHRLCTRCRVGVRARRTPDDQELCESCAMAFTQGTGVGTVEIGDGQGADGEVGDED